MPMKKNMKKKGGKTYSKKTSYNKTSTKTLIKKVDKCLKMCQRDEAELKLIQKEFFNVRVGQSDAAGGGLVSPGVYVQDITPYTIQGNTNADRVGNLQKLISTKIRLQFQNQIAVVNRPRLRLEIWRLVGGLTVASGVVKAMYDPNPFIQNNPSALNSPQVYDLNSLLNPDRVRSAKKIYSRGFRMPDEGFNTALATLTLNVNIKHKTPIKQRFDDANNLHMGQIVLVIFSDTGNIDTTDIGLADRVAFNVYKANTGINFSYFVENAFTDA